MADYTYTIFDANPNTSSGTAWPTHQDLDIEAESDEEALAAVRDVMSTEAAALNTEDGYQVGQLLYAIVWDENTVIVGEPTYELTAGDLGVTATVTLTSYNMGDDATEADYNSWTEFVCRHIDERAGFEVNVEIERFGTAGNDTFVGNLNEGQLEELRHLVQIELWEEWCSNPGFVNAEEAGARDCDSDVSDGVDPAALTEGPGRVGADEALVSAMGRSWVLSAAGAPDDSDASWQSHGLPWCARYSAAYAARAAELVAVAPSDREHGDAPQA